MAELIAGLDADLVGVSEYEPAPAGQLYDLVAEHYPYHAFFPGWTDVGLLSKYPILRKQMLQRPGMRSPVLRTVVDVQGVPVVVYVMHAVSPRVIPWRLRYDGSQRDRELGYLRDFLARETDPMLVLCDCNVSDQNDSYRKLARLVKDSFREVGRGMGFTFPSQRRITPLLVRIDYIWHSHHFVAQQAYPLNVSGTSDHRPVVAVLSFK